MDDIDVPPFFICPISLEIMKDPVTVSTGITYDRESIEKWLFSEKNHTCPVTKQPLSDCSDLTPNHTLRRLIQAWCTMNASHGIERIPTPKPPINKTEIVKLLRHSMKSSQSLLQNLRTLKNIASESETNKRCIESAGAIDFLASVIVNNTKFMHLSLEDGDSDDAFEFRATTSVEALNVLYNINASETGLRSLLNSNNGQFLESLNRVMQGGDYETRAYSVLLMKSIFKVADPMQFMSIRPELLRELVHILKDKVSNQATKATLQVLIQLCPWGRNKVKAVEAGAVTVLIELLLDSKERRPSEMLLTVLDILCGCAEGRSELLSHGAGLALVAKKILRVSMVGNERAVRILYAISKFSATPSVVQEMLQLGVVAKLCLVIQVDSGSKAKEKAREILKLHARAWKNSPCIPHNLVSVYPS